MMIAGRIWTDRELERFAYIRYRLINPCHTRRHFKNLSHKQYRKASKYVDEHPKYKKWIKSE